MFEKVLLVSESAFIMTGCHSHLSPSKKQSSSRSSHVADMVDLHTLVAEHGDVFQGAVKSESLMDVVGKGQARRVQQEAKLVTPSVRHRDREHDQRREKNREMLARVKNFVVGVSARH